LKTSIYNWEEKQNLAKSFHIQQRTENTNTPEQSYPKPTLRDAGTAQTDHAKTNQFRKPGFFDARYGNQSTQSETPSRITTASVRLLPLSPSWYDGTALLDENVIPNSPNEREDDSDFIDSRKTVVVPVVGAFPHPQETRKAANPPYARHRSTLATLTQQYWMLVRVSLVEYRTTWFFHVFSGLLIPISFAFVIIAAAGVPSPEVAIYLLGGNIALSIATGPASFLISKIGWARQSKEYHYWIALPISKFLLVLSIVSVALVFALPGILGIYVLGSLFLGLSFSGMWAFLLLIPLGVLPLTGVGALLGIIAPNGQTANVFSNLLIVIVGVLSPVMLPLESLPMPLRILSLFMPTTYVADAFRAVLGGHGTNLPFDLIILILFSAVLLTITYFRLDWRNA
jgi:ABC-2 type transport system permease protein